MKKIYHIENLDCANCAAKIENKLRAQPAVEEAVIVFPTRQLHLTAQDPDALLPELMKIADAVEPGVVFLAEEAHPSASGNHCLCHDGQDENDCHCHDHCHEHMHTCHCEQQEQSHHAQHPEHSHADTVNGQLLPLLLGAGLFALGLMLGIFQLPWVTVAAFVAAYLVLGLPVLKAAGKNLFRGHVLDENFLMSIATIGAFCIGEYPEAVGIMLFYRIGEFFEDRAVQRSRKQIMDAVDLRPETVTLRDAERVIPAGQAKPGDVLLVRPGDRIPLDGVILSGESRIDTAPITGESVPVGVKAGDRVLSGCVNLSGTLILQVEKPLESSMVTRILQSVEAAAASKPKIDRFISRFARIYTPVVVALAAAVAILPALVTGNWGYWVYTALSFLVMSCPCALVLSVPLAFFSGIGVGSKQGILFKGGASMEALADIRMVAMDKTGTLTHGNFRVHADTEDALLELCASCEQYSAHPIAVSIVAEAKKRQLFIRTPEALEEIPGKGIRCQLEGKTVLCGNEALLAQFGVEVAFAGEPGNTWVLCAVDGKYRGSLAISDEIKPDAAAAVQELTAMGIHSAILTGDHPATAHAVAKKTGISQVFAGLLPAEKLERMRSLRKDYGRVMFVGDGINDAPVLSNADVGAAMGSGSDAALEAADMVFMASAMDSVPAAIRIAKRTKAIAMQNVVVALIIKALVMVLGLAGFASMWLAVFADSGVAMLCVLNSVRMLYTKK